MDNVWECSHIGGDRFAANVVCLPEGVYLGRVSPEEGAAVASDYAEGLLSLDHYRGRSCYPTLVQAAELYVRRAASIREIDGLTLVALDPRSPDLSAALALTCRAQDLARPWEYYVHDLVER